MIPKKIHYCWFGGKPKSGLYRRCIESWKRLCPDYEIIEWNEVNFDLGRYPYLQWCYDRGKWAFISDFARLIILKEQGGIYLDTDVELLRPLDGLLEYGAFMSFENNTYINTGIGLGSEPAHPVLDVLLQTYLEMEPEAEHPGAAAPGPQTGWNKAAGLRSGNPAGGLHESLR